MLSLVDYDDFFAKTVPLWHWRHHPLRTIDLFYPFNKLLYSLAGWTIQFIHPVIWATSSFWSSFYLKTRFSQSELLESAYSTSEYWDPCNGKRDEITDPLWRLTVTFIIRLQAFTCLDLSHDPMRAVRARSGVNAFNINRVSWRIPSYASSSSTWLHVGPYDFRSTTLPERCRRREISSQCAEGQSREINGVLLYNRQYLYDSM